MFAAVQWGRQFRHYNLTCKINKMVKKNMTITENKTSDSLELVIGGRLDTSSAPELEGKLKQIDRDRDEPEYGLLRGLKFLL